MAASIRCWSSAAGYACCSRVGNKASDYNNTDIRSLQLLADETIVRTIIAMARPLGLETVAEGIECAKQLVFLNREKVDFGQVYRFARPLPPDQLLAEWTDQLSLASASRTASPTGG
jgi:predicted signal transduction protein with EAL and GGDEF domain